MKPERPWILLFLKPHRDLFTTPLLSTQTQARSVFLWGIGKDRQAPEHNWTCSYTTTGSWQRLGRRLGSPREAWSLTRPCCAWHRNRITAPPLPFNHYLRLCSPTPTNNTPPLRFLSFDASFFWFFVSPTSPSTAFILLLSWLLLKSGVNGWTPKQTHKIMLRQLSKFPIKFPLALCQIPVR